MKKFILLLLVIWLFAGWCVAKETVKSGVTKYPKSGSYKMTTKTSSVLYGKDGHKKSSEVKMASGTSITTKYDKKGNKTKTVVKTPNGTTKTYNKEGKLVKKKQVTTYQN